MEDNSQALLIPDDKKQNKLEYRRYLILFMYTIYGLVFTYFGNFYIDLLMLSHDVSFKEFLTKHMTITVLNLNFRRTCFRC